MNPENQVGKPEFTPRSLQDWIAKLNGQFPRALKTDWRQVVTDDFELHPWQRKSLTGAPTNRVEDVQKFFVQAARDVEQGGRIDGEIVKLPIERQTEHAVHELHLHSHPPNRTHNLSIVIAHCDAHCKNWGWGPG